MKLTRVTITGADDLVAPEELIALSREFPFVEWGILGSKTLRGAPRFPSDPWMESWREALLGQPVDFHWALHLCGEWSRRALAGCQRVRNMLHTFDRFSYDRPRVQLNGFSKYRLPMLALAEQMSGWEFILQCQTDAALEHAAELGKAHPNVSALWDVSGGRGVLDFDTLTNQVAPEGLLMGRAGGLSPDNLAAVLEELSRLESPLWIDLESGARTDDRFDLAKVRRVLELAKPFVEAT